MSERESQNVRNPVREDAKNKRESRIVKEIEIAASVDDVWKALTDGHELTKWFPLEARVTGGVGGKIFLSWGPDCEGEADIVAWEPGAKFAWREPMALIEWTIAARGQKTLIRLVQSGFAGEADWENEYFDSTNYGWSFMLAGLRLMLEKHPHEERNIAWPRVRTTLTREQAYHKVLGPNGIFVEDAGAKLQPEKSYSLKTTTNETYSGKVEFVWENRGFCVTVRELNDALFWLTLEGAPEKIEVQFWLSAFGIPEEDVNAFNQTWESRLKDMFA